MTALCLVLGFPVAFTMHKLRGVAGTGVLYLVLFPFWISLLVRTYSWLLLLPRSGPVNNGLMALGVVDQPVSLLYTNTAVVIGMTHVLLPYAILPIYARMRSIDPSLLRASAVIAFLVLPILAIGPASLSHARFIDLPPAAYSVRWYAAFFDDAGWLQALMASLSIASASTLIAVALGTAAAIGLRALSGGLSVGLYGLICAPLVMPVIVTAVAIYKASLPLQLNGTYMGMVLSHVVLAPPFVVINVGISLRAVRQDWLKAAAGLGAGPWRVFTTVTLPNIWPGIVGGGVFAFITSFDDFTVAVFMSGQATKTLPIKMWEAMRFEFSPIVAVAATLVVALTAALFLASMAAQALRRKGGL